MEMEMESSTQLMDSAVTGDAKNVSAGASKIPPPKDDNAGHKQKELRTIFKRALAPATKNQSLYASTAIQKLVAGLPKPVAKPIDAGGPPAAPEEIRVIHQRMDGMDKGIQEIRAKLAELAHPDKELVMILKVKILELQAKLDRSVNLPPPGNHRKKLQRNGRKTKK